MKISVLTCLIGLVSLTGCNDIPEVKPVDYQVLSVHPNPASEQAFISVGNQINRPYTLQVFDTKGDVILEEKSSNGQLFNVTLYNKPVGKYHVVVKTDKVVSTLLLVKI